MLTLCKLFLWTNFAKDSIIIIGDKMFKDRLFKHKAEILKEVEKKNFWIRYIFFFLACLVYATCYNAYLVPNNIVIGGMSGLAIVVKELTGLPITYFLYSSMIILIVIAYYTLGKDKAFYTILGSLTYTLSVSVTANFAGYFESMFNNMFIIILLTSVFIGIANGIIFRSGFNTGGSDVISSIVNKYFKIPIGKCNSIVNTIIIICGYLLFGIDKTIYAVFILTISSKLIDVVMLGINDSKMVIIKSNKWEEIENYVMNNLRIGVTEIGNKGGIFVKKNPTLYIIVPFDMYYDFKHKITSIDEKAFVVSHDCYAVLNAYKKRIIPF